MCGLLFLSLCLRGGQHLRDSFGGIGSVEHAGACHDNVCACGGDVRYVGGGDAAVNLDVHVKAVLVYVIAKRSDLFQRCGDKLLSAKAGVNSHDQHHIQLIQIGEQHLGRGLGGDGDTAGDLLCLDGLQGTYMITREDRKRTAAEWALLLRKTADRMDALQRRMQLEKLLMVSSRRY